MKQIEITPDRILMQLKHYIVPVEIRGTVELYINPKAETYLLSICDDLPEAVCTFCMECNRFIEIRGDTDTYFIATSDTDSTFERIVYSEIPQQDEVLERSYLNNSSPFVNNSDYLNQNENGNKFIYS